MTRHYYSLVVALLILCAANVYSQCIFTLPGVEGVFDLRSVGGRVFNATSPHHQYTFEFSICGTVPYCDGSTNTSVCQRWADGEANCGVWDPAHVQLMAIPTPGAKGIGFVVSNGDEGRFSQILIHCNPGALEPYNFVAHDAPTFFDPYVIEFTSAAACNTTLSPDFSFNPTPVYIPPVPVTPPNWVVLPVAEPTAATPIVVPTATPVPIQAPVQPPITIAPALPAPAIIPITVPVNSPVPHSVVVPVTAPNKHHKGLSPGSICLIILAALIPTYILGGVVINCARGKEGSEIFPNRDFWASFPGLLKDGARFLGRPCGLSSNSYEMINQ